MKQEKIKRVAAYCRVSTDNQKEEGTIDLQVDAIKDYCQNRKIELVAVFKDEGVSGGLENRPALADLFNFLEKKDAQVDGVIIWKLDRLARDLYIQEHLIKKLEQLGKKLISTKELDLDSSDPMRKAFRQFMGIVSELEKAFITMRLSGGRIKKAKNGGYAGGATMLGYKAVEHALSPLESEKEVVKHIYHLKRYERFSLGKIARLLNEKEVPTKRGGKWYSGTIKYILENPVYRGVLKYADITANGQHSAIL
jgi:site-specific DNA recombinase